MSGLFEELKRRNVFKVGTAYVVLAWLLAQVTDVFLEPFGAPEWVIKTVLVLLLAGLPVVLIFAWAFELTPEGLKRERDVDRSQSITHQTGQKLNLAIIFILVLALSYFAVDKFVLEPERHTELAQRQPAANTPEAKEPAKSIAVLPFVNMSSDPEQEYFSDGISEEILNALARVKDLKVAGRTSSFAFKGQNQDLRKIGATLGVEHILEGSVRKSGARVRITAQLVQVDDGFHLWSETYERELTDVFAIQDEIANAILTQLKAALLDDGEIRISQARTDSEAYDLYLLARQRMYERAQLPLEAAMELLDRAIAIDPQYAPAFAQRGIATLLLADNSYGTIPNAQAEAQARLFLEQALRLDPGLAEAWAGMGLYHEGRPGEVDRGIELLQRALAINPNLIDAANWLQNAYIGSGRPADALAVLQDLVARDPLYRPGVSNLVFLYGQVGRHDAASALLEATRPYFPNDPTVAQLEANLSLSHGKFARALQRTEPTLELQPNDRVLRVFHSRALAGTHQYERLAAEGYRGWKALGLRHLGRTEEASMLAWDVGPGENIGWLLDFLNATGRSGELIQYLEQQWPSLDAFEVTYPASGYFGYAEMNAVALAYRRAGDQDKFADAMQRVRQAHDSLAAQGLRNPDLWLAEAAWHAMAGRQQECLQHLAAAIDGGLVLSSRIADDMPYFGDLEGDPEYEAIQARMIEHLNAERAALSLEPLET
jgi:TolB-like protein/Tfp pilus assembly protein PilF